MSSKKDYVTVARVLNRGIYYGTQGLPGSEEEYPDTFEGGYDAAVTALCHAFIELGGGQFSVPRFVCAVYKDSDVEIPEAIK
jgi:hypothetical protein